MSVIKSLIDRKTFMKERERREREREREKKNVSFSFQRHTMCITALISGPR
jgi:hypothetical protein